MIWPLYTESYPAWAKNSSEVKNWDKIISWSHSFAIADYDIFDSFFEELDEHIIKNKVKFSNEEISSLESSKFSTELYIKLGIFNSLINKKFPVQEDNPISRDDIYSKNKTPLLSELFKNGNQACVEYSMLAQKFLQDNNIKSSIFFWEVLWSLENIEDLDNDEIYWSAHTYIIIELNNKTFIYDPANPIHHYPRVLEVPWNFYEQMKNPRFSHSKVLLESKDIIFWVKSHYWTGTWDSIYWTHIVDNENPWRLWRVLDNETKKILFEVQYDLLHKWLWEEKASDMYKWFTDEELLNNETFEVEIKNITEIVDLLLENKWIDSRYKNQENLLHTHKMDDYKIMCYEELLKNKETAINTFRIWLLLTSWLIYLKDFSEANTYIKENSDWYQKLSEKFIIRI